MFFFGFSSAGYQPPPPQPAFAQGYPSQQAYEGYGQGQNMGYDQGGEALRPTVPKAGDDYEGTFASSFSDKAIRRGFIRKVIT